MNENNFFVVLRRHNLNTQLDDCSMQDFVSIYDHAEAIKNNWVDKNGERVWIVPSQHETQSTFVWGFVDMDQAISFYNVLLKNELDICVKEV